MKKLVLFVSLFLMLGLFVSPGAIAQSSDENELSESAGITPDSPFYFLDELFDGFGDDLSNKEEKIAEIKQMIEEGNFEAAREALEKYNEFADRLETEIDPEDEEEAKRSAKAIRKALRDIEGLIPEDDRDDFVDDIIDKEDKISAAVEISGKIKELCETLSELDPVQYARTCKSGDDSPKWQRDLDKKLTDEQKEEAEEFFGIMTECFDNPAECRCDEISISSFADACSEIAPLAAACDAGDEDACDEMDELPDPIELLPEHLQDVMHNLESKFDDKDFEKFAPRECVEAGAESKEECMKIMFSKNAPDECVEALERGDLSLDNERDMREGCEKIMFESNAPDECIEAGLTDHRECGQLMFKQNAPEECIEAGLTGEDRNDNRECDKIMRSLNDGEDHRGRGPGEFGPPGQHCKGIDDSEERLKCFDGALSGVREEHQGFERNREAENECRESCEAKSAAWDMRSGECECHSGEDFRDDRREDRRRFPPECQKEGIDDPEDCKEFMNDRKDDFEDHKNNFEGDQGNIVDGGPEFREEFEDDFRNGGSEFRDDFDDSKEEFNDDFKDERNDFDDSGNGESHSDSNNEVDNGGSDSDSSGSSDSNSESSDGGSSDSESSDNSAGITGEVIFEDTNDNAFVKYYFDKWFG